MLISLYAWPGPVLVPAHLNHGTDGEIIKHLELLLTHCTVLIPRAATLVKLSSLPLLLYHHTVEPFFSLKGSDYTKL